MGEAKTSGGRWGAIDVLCEVLFGELVRFFGFRFASAENRPETQRSLPEASRGFPEPFEGFFEEKDTFHFFIFSSKFNMKKLFVMGEAKMLTILCETS